MPDSLQIDSTGRLRPIGVFDSGVGGLSVLREIRREFPHEHFIYVADSKHAPYGDRDPAFITARSVAIAAFLVEQRAKAIVVACNTATGVAVEALRQRFALPVIGIEPAVKPAVGLTRSGCVGVLTTTQTAAAEKFSRLVGEHAARARILVQACPGLVEQVEQGELATAATRTMVEQYVRPLVDQGADVLVLGCTHYPFLDAVIRAAAGPAVAIIDPAVAVARQLRRRLEEGDLLAPPNEENATEFWTSGEPAAVIPTIAQLWTGPVNMSRLPSAVSSQP